MLAEDTVGHEASMKSLVKTGRQRKTVLLLPRLRARRRKFNEQDGVSLTPPPDLEASRAKVVSQNNPCHRRGGSNVKIYSKKLDYSKVKAKVDTGRKTYM
jgi:hypothetical protein